MSVSRIAAWLQQDNYGVNGLSYTPPTGNRRCAVLVVGAEENGAVTAGPMSIASATLGGQACVIQAPATLQAGTNAGYHNTATIITLNEAGISAMSGNAFLVTWTNFPGNGPFETSPVVHYATFQDVDQANINSANQSNTSDANVSVLSPTATMNVAVDELVIAVNVAGQPNTPSSSAGGLVEQTEYIGAANDMSLAVYERTALTADAAYTFTMNLSAATRMVVVGMALGFDGGAPSPVYDQDSFRGRNDDGSESAATWKETVNTNWSQDIDENFRVRFLIEETADEADADVQFQLQYNKNSGGWNDVNAASANVRSFASPNVVDGANTTEQLAGPGTFLTSNAGFDEVNGLVGGTALDFSATINEEVELEFCVQIRGVDVSGGDTIQLRVVKEADIVLGSYTNTPTVTVLAPAYEQDSFRGRNDDGSESAATWIAAINTDWTQNPDENFRVRFLVEETADAVDLDVTFQLQYNKNSGGWNDVNAASTNVRSSASPNVVDGADTTKQMGGPGTFLTNNDGFDEVDGLAGGAVLDFSATINEEVEVEFCIQIRTAETAPGDTIELRAIRAPSAAFATYTQIPTLTLPSLAFDQDGFQFINDNGSESGATSLAAEDANLIRGKALNTRLRIQIDTVGDDPPSATRTLQYKEVGDPAGEWRDVPLT